MILTKYAIEKMGYSEYPQSDSLEVEFGIIKAYSLRGMNFEKDCQKTQSEVVAFGNDCNIAISQSINEASRLLTGDAFTDENEEKWLSKKKATPPFILIYFKENSPRVLNGGYRQEKNGYIYTYDAFPEGKIDIRNWEKDSLPSIITSLTVHFSTLDSQITLVPVERSIFGTTKEGKTLFDLKVTGSAEIIVSSAKKVSEINSSLHKSKELFSKLTKETSRHIHAALNESDKLKQFLNYFLFIERYTHSQYKLLSYQKDACKAFNIPDRLVNSGKLFFENRFKDSRNLAQRFHWCAMLAWEHIDDLDLSCFLKVKVIRDKVTHGEDIDEANLPVEKIKLLALKLLGTEKT